MNTANCTLSSFQSETIAFTLTKNAPTVKSEGALYQKAYSRLKTGQK